MTSEQLHYFRAKGIRFFDVYEIFKEHFGEAFVDISGYTEDELIERCTNSDCPNVTAILIHFPHVKVTNENDKFVYIDDLWAKVYITKKGSLGLNRLEMTRTTFSSEQAISGYAHSHLPRNTFGNWKNPCLGTGPINRTMDSLAVRFDEYMWMLFCRELSEYVQVESLTGGPYIKLESIGAAGTFINFDVLYSTYQFFNNKFTLLCTHDTEHYEIESSELLKEILLRGKLKYCYYDGSYHIAMSNTQFAILVSNITLELISERCNMTRDILKRKTHQFNEYIYSNGQLYSTGILDRMDSFDNSTTLFTFKGREIKLVLTNLPEITYNTVLILHNEYLCRLYKTITILINSLYGKTTECETCGRITVL